MEKIAIKPKEQLTKADVQWALFDNIDGSATMHHLLYDVMAKRKWTGEEYVRNGFICNKKWRVLDENEQAPLIANVDSASKLHRNIACKHCLKFWDSLKD